MRGSVLISTTEHLLSALIGYGVDNVIVEIDNLELPILDGSALPYVEAFAAVGLKQQRRRREYLRILKPVEVREGTKFIGVYPGTGYGIDYTIDFPRPIGSESFSTDLETGDYARLIAPARTFGFSRPEATRPSSATWVSSAAPRPKLRHHPHRRRRAEPAPAAFPTASSSATRSSTSSATSPSPVAASRAARQVAERCAGHAMHTALVQRLLRDRSACELAPGYDSAASEASTASPSASAAPLRTAHA